VSLLTIVQDAALRCELAQPTSAFSSPDLTTQQLVGFAADAGRELVARCDWRNLKISGQCIGDGASTLFQCPLDFKRLAPSDKSPKGALVSSLYPTLPLFGPVNDEDLLQMKAFPSWPTRPVWRLIGTTLEIWPALAVNEVVSFTYYSKNWILAGDGLTKRQRWGADSDTSLIDEDTIMEGTVWRFKASKGFDYAEEFRAYENSVNRNAGQEGTERVVSTSSRQVNQDSWWPGVISYTAP
jgi:hypothetical protein